MTKNKKYLFSLVLLLISGKILATEQSMDKLIYNDSVSFLFSENLLRSSGQIWGYPLENFIDEQYTDSTKWAVIEEMRKSYRWCMRGYIATWKIRNDSLFLMEISYGVTGIAFVQGQIANSFPLERLFPGRDITNGVFADWYSGIIRTVEYEQEYPSFYDDYWKNKRKIFVITEGKLVGVARK